jgi:hypothetical protein
MTELKDVDRAPDAAWWSIGVGVEAADSSVTRSGSLQDLSVWGENVGLESSGPLGPVEGV